MAVAWALTLLAIAGVLAGTVLGQSRWFTAQVAVAGGGLLFGIALFWVVPEIAEISGWWVAAPLAIAGFVAVAATDVTLEHLGHSPRSGAVAPLLGATAVHCFLDGWSVRALGGKPMTNIAVAIGLALHKLPEGVALGYILRRALSGYATAVVLACAIELVTALAAAIEPRANATGTAALGPWWSATVLAVISGSFLYLGLHVVIPERHKRGVVPLFIASLVVMAAMASLRV